MLACIWQRTCSGRLRRGREASKAVMSRRSSTMSIAMFSPIPGRCTFRATSSPVLRSRPLYTCVHGQGHTPKSFLRSACRATQTNATERPAARHPCHRATQRLPKTICSQGRRCTPRPAIQAKNEKAAGQLKRWLTADLRCWDRARGVASHSHPHHHAL